MTNYDGILSAMRKQITVKTKWMGAALYNLDWRVEKTENGTVQTDGSIITIDPSMIGNQEGFYHVVANVISASMAHPERMHNRDPIIWNAACAHVTYHTLKELGVLNGIKLPANVLDLSQPPLSFPTNKTPEIIYEMLMDILRNKAQNQQQKQQQSPAKR